MGMVKIDASKLVAATRQIAEAAGIQSKIVLRNEVAVILKKCAGETKVGTAAKADVTSRKYQSRLVRGVFYGSRSSKIKPGQSFINTGIRGPSGQVWYRTAKGKFQPVYGPGFKKGWRIADGDWPTVDRATSLYRGQVNAAIQRGRASIGLARQSWVQIADSLGISLEAVKGGGTLSGPGIAKARAAIASTGKPYQNGQGTEYSAASNAVITIINGLPYGRAIAMDTVLAKTVEGREKFFARNVQHGMLESAAKIARAYPGLKVHMPPPGD